jgi:hypothetical protein
MCVIPFLPQRSLSAATGAAAGDFQHWTPSLLSNLLMLRSRRIAKRFDKIAECRQSNPCPSGAGLDLIANATPRLSD